MGNLVVPRTHSIYEANLGNVSLHQFTVADKPSHFYYSHERKMVGIMQKKFEIIRLKNDCLASYLCLPISILVPTSIPTTSRVSLSELVFRWYFLVKYTVDTEATSFQMKPCVLKQFKLCTVS